MSEKTEKPTPKKIKDARKKGQVAKSNEITTGAQLAIIYVYFTFFGHQLFDKLKQIIIVTFESLNLPLNIAIHNILLSFQDIVFFVGFLLGGLLFIFTVFIIIIQTGPLIASESIKPSAKKLNPLGNIKNIFSMKSLFEFFKNCLKVILLTLIFFYILSKYSNSMQYLPMYDIGSGIKVTTILISWLWGSLLIFYIIFGAADFAFQKHSTMKQLKMSKDEIKKEFKNSEGNPEIKSKRKQVHQEIQSGSLANNVKKSSFVVKNPTHVAVCIFYDEIDSPVPKVIEKQLDSLALQVIKIAEKNNIPIIEDIKLARNLYSKIPLGKPIVEEFYEHIAEILRMINNLDYEL